MKSSFFATISTAYKTFAQAGQAIAKSDGSGFWMCIGRADTTTTAAYGAGVNSLTVASAAGMNTGDAAAVLLEDRTTQWTVISAIAGNTIRLSAALSGNVSAGASVAAMSWL
ncbi:hypothetical protein [Paenibacillus ginsengarvi]|uniref:DUF2190 family protein n=1 Tax=Paenibacillus ginsengarvi TaxID=400777 RepID=A0A3B0AMT9_9BACL|nr:hypothetical protein [Paenibacillus ginsengarvi]RKN61932.1 hypothetical protein D7M11_35240 [Paenibacillus ginsengarvi]